MIVRGNIIVFVLEYLASISRTLADVNILTESENTTFPCRLHGTLSLGIAVNHTDIQQSQNVPQFQYLLPDDVTFPSLCSPSAMEVQLESRDKLFIVSLVFQTKTQLPDYRTWAVTNVTLRHKGDNSTRHTAHALDKRGGGTARKNGRMLFETPANRTYKCTSRQYIYVGPEKDRATVVFSQVRLQPFSDIMRVQGEDGYICAEDYKPQEHAKHAGIIIPVILAVSLAVVLFLLLIGYIIHKKIEGMGYVNMD